MTDSEIEAEVGRLIRQLVERNARMREALEMIRSWDMDDLRDPNDMVRAFVDAALKETP